MRRAVYLRQLIYYLVLLELEQALKVFYPDSRVGVRAHSFPVRVIYLWNRLPSPTVLAENTVQNIIEIY